MAGNFFCLAYFFVKLHNRTLARPLTQNCLPIRERLRYLRCPSGVGPRATEKNLKLYTVRLGSVRTMRRAHIIISTNTESVLRTRCTVMKWKTYDREFIVSPSWHDDHDVVARWCGQKHTDDRSIVQITGVFLDAP